MNLPGVPHVFTPLGLAEDLQTSCKHVNDSLLPLRPIQFSGLCLLWRLRIAYKVFVGEYDALRWPDDGEYFKKGDRR